MSSALSRFKELRDGTLGDPHQLDDRLKILWVLSMVRDDPSCAYLTPAEISEILRDIEGIDVSRQMVAAVLQSEKGVVTRKKIGGKNYYKGMQKAHDELKKDAFASTYVDPERALSEIRKLEDLLRTFRGTLSICDPYVENKTLDYLAECTAADAINLLTVNVLKESKFRRDSTAFSKEHSMRLEIRVAAGGLHDRYILHADGMLLLGTSLNGFAKKQSFLVSLGPDIRSATEGAFNRAWASAAKF